MSLPRLIVVDPSVQHPETEGVRQVMRGASPTSWLLQPALCPGDGPLADTPYDFDGAVVLGSASSVYDDLPWLDHLSRWVRPILEGEVSMPLLGVCFGHQLVAHLAGGTVGYLAADHGKRVGVEDTRVDGSRLLAEPTTLRVVVSHREEVKEVPAGYRRIARRPGAEIDGLDHDSLPIHTFQFHPEARADFMRGAGIDAALLDERLIRDSRRVLDAFLATCSR